MYKIVQPLRTAAPGHGADFFRNILLFQDAAPDRVVRIMMNIGDLIRKPDNAPFQRGRHGSRLMIPDAIPYLHGQIDALSVLLQHIHGPHTLFVVPEPIRTCPVQRPLPGMAKGRVPQIVPQSDGLHQIFIELQRLGDRPGRLAHLQRVCQPRPVMVTLRRKKHLCLVFQPAKRLAVNDPVPVPLKNRPDITLFFRLDPPSGIHAEHGIWT